MFSLFSLNLLVMKKIFLLAAAMFVTSLSVNAEKRTKSQILSAAAEVLQEKCPMTSSMNKAGAKLQILDNSKSQLSIVGYENGAYVIVANDDAMPAILGYSDADVSFDADNLPPAFKWYLEIANRNIEERLVNGQAPMPITINPNYKPEVPMMCQTKWGQGYPFNDQTPVYNGGTHYVTGCVATAMAQAMNYYKYPDTGRGKITFYVTSDDGQEKVKVGFDDEPYDWNNMLDVYEQYKFNSDNTYAVSYLMKHTGASVMMNYAPGGSGAYTSDAAFAFNAYFKYDPSVDCYRKDLMHEEEWFDLVYHNLSDGHPLVFGASSSIGGQDAGHSFVVDGYDTKGLVHVNFGWEGEADGFYQLLDMHGYDHGFDMIPLKKPSDDLKIKSFWGLWSRSVVYNKNTGVFDADIINGSARDFTGKIFVMLKNLADGTEQIIGYESYKDEGLIVDGNRYNVKNFKVQAPLPEDLPDGQYRLYLASKGAWWVKDDPTSKREEPKLLEEAVAQPIHAHEALSNSYIITVEGGSVKAEKELNSNWVLGIDDVICKNFTSDIVKVYDVQGRMIYTAKANDFRIADVPADGVLIIKNGSDVRKVIK